MRAGFSFYLFIKNKLIFDVNKLIEKLIFSSLVKSENKMNSYIII